MALRTQTLLIVDDEADILESLKDLFEASIDHLTVRIASSGAKGLQILTSEPVDLVISDYKMPGMNGLEFLAKAKDAAPGVPRILATAFPDLDIAVRAINDTQIESFITKPFEPEKAIEVVQGVLNKRRSERMKHQSFARSLDVLRKGKGEA